MCERQCFPTFCMARSMMNWELPTRSDTLHRQIHKVSLFFFFYVQHSTSFHCLFHHTSSGTEDQRAECQGWYNVFSIEGWGEQRSLLLEKNNLLHRSKTEWGELESSSFVSGSRAAHIDAACELSVTGNPHWYQDVKREMSPFFQGHKIRKLNPD